MDRSINEKDKLVIIKKYANNSYNYDLIIDFYQVIMGSMACSFYFTLLSFITEDKTSKDLMFKDLLHKMNINLMNLEASKNKLEAIGLLKTYFYQNNYVLEIYPPLGVYEIVNNQILNTVLYNNLGSKMYNILLDKYRNIELNMNDYIEITKKFDEVFNVTSLNDINNTDNLNYEISYLNIKRNIDFYNINNITLSNKEKETLNILAYLYNLSDSDITDLINVSLNSDMTIDMELIKKRIKDVYFYENGSMPTLVYKDTKIKPMSRKEKLLHTFEMVSPYEYLKSKSSVVSKREMTLIEDLMIKYKLIPEVVNVLISYVLQKNKQNFNRTYVETIASQWSRLNFKTAEEAMNHCINFKTTNKNEKTKVKYVRKKERTEELPEWFDQEKSKDDTDIEELQKIMDF